MNKAGASPKRRRAGRRGYDNRLREQQAGQTRQRIVEAVAALLAEGEDDFSIALLAERSGVSEPTVYRNFANRDALLAAVNEHLRARLPSPRLPESLDDIPPAAVELFAYFAANEPLIRAALRAGMAGEIRQRERGRRNAQVQAALAEGTGHLDERRARAVYAVFRQLVRAECYVALVDEYGVPPDVAGEAIGWAVATLADGLRRHRASGRTTLLDTTSPRKRR